MPAVCAPVLAAPAICIPTFATDEPTLVTALEIVATAFVRLPWRVRRFFGRSPTGPGPPTVPVALGFARFAFAVAVRTGLVRRGCRRPALETGGVFGKRADALRGGCFAVRLALVQFFVDDGGGGRLSLHPAHFLAQPLPRLYRRRDLVPVGDVLLLDDWRVGDQLLRLRDGGGVVVRMRPARDVTLDASPCPGPRRQGRCATRNHPRDRPVPHERLHLQEIPARAGHALWRYRRGHPLPRRPRGPRRCRVAVSPPGLDAQSRVPAADRQARVSSE
ncbi:MAG: hypothetical protein IPG47_04355 [Thermoflexaceae bacterium]|nr:hypothetical protein [Thermoflexaceae bacterium]